jgi:hypothetical protein
MMNKVTIVDRTDQLEWYIDSDWFSLDIKVDKDKRLIREWLEEMAIGKVVIFGRGTVPQPNGIEDRTWQIFDSVRQGVYRVYFEKTEDAMTFKLRWGGDV